jgi:hypothetical protein
MDPPPLAATTTAVAAAAASSLKERRGEAHHVVMALPLPFLSQIQPGILHQESIRVIHKIHIISFSFISLGVL